LPDKNVLYTPLDLINLDQEKKREKEKQEQEKLQKKIDKEEAKKEKLRLQKETKEQKLAKQKEASEEKVRKKKQKEEEKNSKGFANKLNTQLNILNNLDYSDSDELSSENQENDAPRPINQVVTRKRVLDYDALNSSGTKKTKSSSK